MNAFAAAEQVLIPMQCEYYALEGLSDLVGTIKRVRAHLNPRLEIAGLLRTMFDPRNTLAHQVSQQLEQHFGDKVYRTLVPRNVRLAEAPSYGAPGGDLGQGLEGRAGLCRAHRGDPERLSMNKPKGLGRGLDALLGGGEDSARKDAQATLPVGAIRPGKYQPRTRMDEKSLQELAASIKAQGLMQPLLVRPVGRRAVRTDRRRAPLARGADRRARARCRCWCARCRTTSALAMALIENIQREDLNPIEEAAGLQRLIEEFRMTHEQAADAVGRSRSATTNLLRLLKLAKPVQAMLMQGTLEMGHARALLGAGRRAPDRGGEPHRRARPVGARKRGARRAPAARPGRAPQAADRPRPGAPRGGGFRAAGHHGADPPGAQRQRHDSSSATRGSIISISC